MKILHLYFRVYSEIGNELQDPFREVRHRIDFHENNAIKK